MSSRTLVAGLGLGLALGSGGVAAQGKNDAARPTLQADTLLPAADLRADAALLRRAYEALHPGLRRYNTPAQLDDAFRALDDEFRQDRTLAQAYLAFSVLAAKIKCGHTYANFFNQSQAVADALFRSPRLPFHFRWLARRMIVTRSWAADGRLRAGTEVLTLDGVPAADVLARLMTVARADGGNDAKRVAYLQLDGSSRFEAFDVYWPLLFPPRAALVTLRVRGPRGARVDTLRVPLASYADRLAWLAASAPNDPPKDAPLWKLRELGPRLGYLRMPTWVLYNSSWDWKASLAAIFSKLATSGATDLVIDLRGNEGGSNVGDVLVSHLIAKPVPRQAVTRMVRYRRVPDDLVPHLDTWDPSFKDWGAAASEATDGFYRLRRDADDDPLALIEPAAPRFGGRVWVLVDAANSSATFEFAQTVRQNRLGTLVGQTTGGNQRGINGGAFFFLRLPRSGIELDLPLVAQFPDGHRPDAGLEPDVPVVQAQDDVARGRDAELEAVRARLRPRAHRGPLTRGALSRPGRAAAPPAVPR